MARLRGPNDTQYFLRFPSSARVTDLSQLISESMAVYPGDPRPRTRLLTTIEGAGASTTELVLGTHTGTHVDAPRHVLPEGRSVRELPLETFYGSAWVYDLTHKPRGSRISSRDLSGHSSFPEGRDRSSLYRIKWL